MKVRKIVILDENIKFPTCHVCGKELSPFLIKKEDAVPGMLEFLFEAGLVLQENPDDTFIVFLCRDCCAMEKIEEDET